jgi:crossover junction endodeoxyribonuclease RuvC
MIAARAGLESANMPRGWSRRPWSATARRKAQVHAMVRACFPRPDRRPDAADALAVAITHAHHLASARVAGRRT